MKKEPLNQQIQEHDLTRLGYRPINGQEWSKWIDEYEGTSLYVTILGKSRVVGLCVFGKPVWSTLKINTIEDLTTLYNLITGKKQEPTPLWEVKGLQIARWLDETNTVSKHKTNNHDPANHTL